MIGYEKGIGNWRDRIFRKLDRKIPFGERISKKFKYDYLEAIAENVSGSLTIWEADLLNEGSYDESMKDCEVVFHTASPFSINVKDPQRQLVDPALKGAKNALSSVNKRIPLNELFLQVVL